MRALVLVALCTAAAHADPAPAVHAGPQAAPPVHAGEPSLHPDLDGRRHVSGCRIGETCTASDVLREFELEAFPPPGDNPWIDERTPPASRLEANPLRRVTRPSELRPDAPWLDQLAMPDLPVTWTPKLIDYLVFYKDDPRGHAIMASWLAAQGRYRDLIQQQLRAAHVPEDLLYDAMIESSYDPDERSSAGAVGLWQFMRAGGKIYGLREDHWVDERRDPLRSTMAAAAYWRDLYERFGNWEVALAAYNAGYGAVLRSIARYNTNDYYQLCSYENGLPWSTCLYTPKVLAAAIVGHNRALFGFDKVQEDPPERWEEVAVPTSLSLSIVARAAGTSEKKIEELNPQLRRHRTPPGEAGYLVRVPVGAKADFPRKLAELESDWDGYDAYVLAHGQRFEDVATLYGISVSRLRRLNGVEAGTEVPGGTVLVVPRISAAQRTKNAARAKAKLLSSGVDGQEGEPLIVPVPDKDATVPGKKRVFYRVVSGDTLWQIARSLGVTSRELATWNAIDPDAKLQPRMVLLAWVDPAFDPAKHQVRLLDESQLEIVDRGSPGHLDVAEERVGRVRTEYVATGREKLSEIAKKFGMGSHDLARINRISYDTVLDKGDKVIVYQVVDPTRSDRAEEQWKKMSRRARRAARKSMRARAAREASQPTHATGGSDAGAHGGSSAHVRQVSAKGLAPAVREVSAKGAEPTEVREVSAKSAAAKHDDAKHGDAKHDEAKPAAAKHDEAKHDEAKHDEAKPEHAKPDDTKSGGGGPVTRPAQVE